MRFIPQGGRSRRYFDSLTGHYCSRRQMLKRSGICPEKKAQDRHIAGVMHPHKVRCDVGLPRRQYDVHLVKTSPSLRAEPHIFYIHGYVVTVLHESGSAQFLVTIPQAHSVSVTQVIRPDGRRRFVCDLCQEPTRREEQIACHVMEHHYAPLAVSRVDVIRYRPSRERRARMPWRAPQDPDSTKISPSL
jgi:hypothetical protein